tara:strand:+ start:509 stop:679 length:171 start_codon:yes stop_codon:yes gene_type:complete
MKELYSHLKELIEELEVNLNKAEKGNKSAGVRLRKEIKKAQALLKELRSESLKERE